MIKNSNTAVSMFLKRYARSMDLVANGRFMCTWTTAKERNMVGP